MSSILTPAIEPVLAIIPPVKNTFCEYKPNPAADGSVPCKSVLLNPLKSPSLAFKSTS